MGPGIKVALGPRILNSIRKNNLLYKITIFVYKYYNSNYIILSQDELINYKDFYAPPPVIPVLLGGLKNLCLSGPFFQEEIFINTYNNTT